MNRIERAAQVTMLAALLAVAVPARATQGLVVILGPSSDHPTVAQMRNELLLLGFDVSVLWSAEPVAELARVGRRYEAAAVARVVDWPPEVVVWVDPARIERPADEPNEIHVSDSLTAPPEHRLLALGAVELLRGKLLPVPSDAPRTTQSPSPHEAEPPAPSLERPRETAPVTAPAAGLPVRITTPAATSTTRGDDAARAAEHPAPGAATFRARPAVLLGPSGTPATPHVHLGAGFDLAWRLGVEADVLVPTTSGTISSERGRVDLRTLLLTGGLSARLTERQSPWLASVSLGAGAAGLFFAGSAQQPYEGRDGSRWAFAPYAAVAGGYYVHPMLAVRADVLATVLTPEPVVRIAAREEATIGRPAIVLGAGIQVRP